jgi:hypothetical protein
MIGFIYKWLKNAGFESQESAAAAEEEELVSRKTRWLRGCGTETPFYATPFSQEKTIVCQDRLGTSMRKRSKVRRHCRAIEAFAPVRKTPLFEPFIYKMRLFTKTGSGQT